MPTLFSKTKKKSCSPFLVTNRDLLRLYKLLLGFIVFTSFIQRSTNKTCFEIDGSDYTLDCLKDEKAITSALYRECRAYNDSGDDCAHFFINTLKFCSGIFGGATCTLAYHDTHQPDDCAVQVINQKCHVVFGTVEDIVATTVIVLGSLLTLSLLTCFLIRCVRKPASEARLELGAQDQNSQEAMPINTETSSYGTTSDRGTQEASSKDAGQAAGAVVGLAVEMLVGAALHCSIQ